MAPASPHPKHKKQSNGPVDSAPDAEAVGPAVGYASPPKHSRWEKGQSGNPSGRRKGQKNLTTLFQEHMAESMPIALGGRQVRIERREALVLGLIGDALKGKERPRRELLELLFRIEADAPVTVTNSAEDEEIIRLFLKRREKDAARQKPNGEADKGPASPAAGGSAKTPQRKP